MTSLKFTANYEDLRPQVLMISHNWHIHIWVQNPCSNVPCTNGTNVTIAFVIWSKLTVHKLSKHEQKYQCNQFDHEATQCTNLKAHKKKYEITKEYIWSECRYQRDSQSFLNIHTKSKHEGLRFICYLCAKTFTQRKC